MCKPSKIKKHDTRQKEFSLMSKGLGAKYVSDKMALYHKADCDNRMYVSGRDGKKYSMPRYYKNKIYTAKEQESATESCLKKHAKKESERLIRVSDHRKDYNKKVESVKSAFRIMEKNDTKTKI